MKYELRDMNNCINLQRKSFLINKIKFSSIYILILVYY